MYTKYFGGENMETTAEYNIRSFDKILEQIDQVGNDVQRERGTLFESLVLAYLKNEPLYRRLYKNVWLLSEVPSEYGIPKKDTGVDIVAEQFNGDLVAIQAKYYKNKIGKSEINSFVAETGKRYYQSGMIVSTVDEWNDNARETIEYNAKDIEIIGLTNLRNSQLNWADFDFSRPEETTIQKPKELRFYQKTALERALTHFENNDRGQLIMAPGTGKTFTSLKIAESLAEKKNKQFKVLYLVPSIQLLTQTLRGWNNDTKFKMASMAVTSDRDASRGTNGSDDIKATDIGYPATTSKEKLIQNWKDVQHTEADAEMLVVFSTYHSIGVISEAQKEGFPEFDLILADEAHRTTGAHEAGKDESHFTKVHDNNIVKGTKRLYQTATPKIYGDNAKKSAKDKSILLSSMDDESKYGEVIYRMGFGQAVSHGILTDYKVMVLAIDESAIQKDMQKTLSDPENGLNIDDVGRIVGIWNGMMRRNGFKNPVKNSPYDGAPLERAIAFTRTIADSKKVTQQFEEVVNDYLGNQIDEESIHLSMKHADGSMNALEKGEVLDWLADPDKPADEARIVSNVRFLTEGIDVPTLDAIIFLAAKKSQVDIVQAVGRIMRKSENKDYGYIILPIVIPQGETPETILDNNKQYEAIWQVINALRSVDERFEAMIDKLNVAKPKQLKVIGIGSAPDRTNTESGDLTPDNEDIQGSLEYEWDQYEAAIYGKIVEKVGDRRYLENWSKDVAKIAQRQITWIKTKLQDKKDPITIEFKQFVESLQHNINEDIDEDKSIEMLSQHLITKPIFEALFEEFSFVHSNPVSAAMENIVMELEKAGFAKEQENLAPLYESVKMRAEGVEKAEDKQNIIITLYDKFFSTAFKSTAEQLGIVFTPIEVVDFIVKSVDSVLNKHFSSALANEGVHILDPFTGTGTFIVRTLAYFKQMMDNGEITLREIVRKYTQELHANELILLSYYIAAINIEATFDEINGHNQGYIPFEGIVLTDTFESTENENTLADVYFRKNDNRLKRQKQMPITAIIGNPPYSMGNMSGNVENVDEITRYEKLDDLISKTYVKKSSGSAANTLYDSYIRSFRWATDRIRSKGVIGFVSNASFIDGKSADGFRKSLYEEFNYIYIYNLRGDQRTQGEKSRKEGGKIFGSGSRAPIAITILVKDESDNHEIYYHDIGDYLDRNEKLDILKTTESINNVEWTNIKPNEHGDWINQRNDDFLEYSNMNGEIFIDKSLGVESGRDILFTGYSKKSVKGNVNGIINDFNENFSTYTLGQGNITSSLSFLWNKKLRKNREKIDSQGVLVEIAQRPFTKKWLYFDKQLIDAPGKLPAIWNMDKENLTLSIVGAGSNNDFSVLITNKIMHRHYSNNGQGFFLYNVSADLSEHITNISDSFKEKVGLDDDSTFYYIYGLLHHETYRNQYSVDLNKVTPHIPVVENIEKYVTIGKKLAELHLNYEYQSVWEGVEVSITNKNPNYKVTKMKHPKRNVLDTIIYNEDITIKNIPTKAYSYIVNGKPAIEWIIDQYRVKTDKKSGIIDDPNGFSDNPKYILNLLLSVITVSMKTLELIDQLPPFEVVEG